MQVATYISYMELFYAVAFQRGNALGMFASEILRWIIQLVRFTPEVRSVFVLAFVSL